MSIVLCVSRRRARRDAPPQRPFALPSFCSLWVRLVVGCGHTMETAGTAHAGRPGRGAIQRVERAGLSVRRRVVETRQLRSRTRRSRNRGVRRRRHPERGQKNRRLQSLPSHGFSRRNGFAAATDRPRRRSRQWLQVFTIIVLTFRALRQKVSLQGPKRGGSTVISPEVQRRDVRPRASGHEQASANARVSCLTEREREVLNLTMDGCASKMVAFRLGISVRTVEAHRTNILRKTSTRNFIELSRYWWQTANYRK